MFEENLFIWFDLTYKKYFVKSLIDIEKMLKVISKPSLLNRDYLTAFNLFKNENSLECLAIKYGKTDIYYIMKISKDEIL